MFLPSPSSVAVAAGPVSHPLPVVLCMYVSVSVPPPDKDGSEGSNTVFIDTSALGELSSQLTPQDLESLVGFNIHQSDLEALQDAAEAHVRTTLLGSFKL